MKTLIGQMNKRVKIQKLTTIANEIGGYTENWVDVATVWASFQVLNGKEYIQARQIENEISTKIVIRYISGINVDMRISLGSRVFTIESIINPEEKNEELQLMCKEVM